MLRKLFIYSSLQYIPLHKVNTFTMNKDNDAIHLERPLVKTDLTGHPLNSYQAGECKQKPIPIFVFVDKNWVLFELI